MSIGSESLTSFGVGLIEVGIFLGFLAGMWKLLNVSTRSFDDHEEILAGRNWAYLVQRLGITAAQAAGMLSTVGVSHPARWGDLGWLALSGVWVSGLLLAARPVIDRTVGRRLRHPNDARSDNLAVSIAKAAFYVSFGFVVNGSLTGTAPNLGTGLAAMAYLNSFGREAEMEADAFAVKVLPKAGYDPNGLVTFFQTLTHEAQGRPQAPGFLSSHPATADRIEFTQAAIDALPPTAGLRVNDGGKLEIVQRRIQLLTSHYGR